MSKRSKQQRETIADDKTTRVDSFEPDYERCCEVCGAVPIVTAVIDGEPVEFGGSLCGPCTWGEAAMLDPANWNADRGA